ncbi:MAG: aspartate kinase, partial [Pseudomonadota bacterium]
MDRLVLKFGGTSVADVAHIAKAAQHVLREKNAGHDVIVVVSAMAGVTNQLVAYVNQAYPGFSAREYDMV